MANETEELRLSLLKEMRDVTIELANKNAELKLTQGEIFKGREQELATLKSLREEARASKELLDGTLDTVKKRAASQLEELTTAKEGKKLFEEMSAAEQVAFEKKKNQLEKVAGLTQKQLEYLREENGEFNKAVGIQEKIIKHSEKIAKHLGGFTGVTAAWNDTLYGSFVGLLKSGAALASIGDSFRQLGKNAGTVMENIIGSGLMKVQEATLSVATAQTTAIANFEKATSSSGKYTDQIVELNFTNRSVGITTQEAAAAFADLDTNLRGFRFMTEDVQSSMADLVATLEKSGVSSKTASKNLNFMMGALGKTAPQAELLTRQLAGLADSLGVAASAIHEDLGSAISSLAHYGDQMIGVFAKMQGAALALKTDMSSTLDFTEQFNTIEGTAKAAGNINALMGSRIIDPMEMMHLDSAETMRAFVAGVHQSGRAAEFAGNKLAVLAFARNSGIKDTAMALKILETDLSTYDEMTAKAKLTAKSQEALDAQAAKAMDTFKLFKVIIENFAISIQPVVETFRDIVVAISQFNEEYKGIIPIFLGVLGILKLTMIATRAMFALETIRQAAQTGGFLRAIALRKQTAVVSTAAHTKRMAELAAEQTAQANLNRTNAAGGAGAANAAAMMAKAAVIAAYGVAFAGLGTAVYLTAEAFATLAAAFKKFDWDILLGSGAAIVVIAGGFFLMAKGLMAAAVGGTAAALPLLAVGAAILAIGAGVFLAVYGFVLLGKSGLEAAEAMLTASLAMGIMAAATAVMAFAGWGALVGFGALAAGLVLIGLALQTISTKDLTALGDMFGGLGKIAKAGGVDLANMKKHVTDLAELAEGMEGKAIGTYIKFADATEKFGFAGENITAPAMTTRYAPSSSPAAAAQTPNNSRAGSSSATSDRNVARSGENNYKFYLSIGEEDFKPYIEKIVKSMPGQ
jgi:hypothetical protein